MRSYVTNITVLGRFACQEARVSQSICLQEARGELNPGLSVSGLGFPGLGPAVPDASPAAPAGDSAGQEACCSPSLSSSRDRASVEAGMCRCSAARWIASYSDCRSRSVSMRDLFGQVTEAFVGS